MGGGGGWPPGRGLDAGARGGDQGQVRECASSNVGGVVVVVGHPRGPCRRAGGLCATRGCRIGQRAGRRPVLVVAHPGPGGATRSRGSAVAACLVAFVLRGERHSALRQPRHPPPQHRLRPRHRQHHRRHVEGCGSPTSIRGFGDGCGEYREGLGGRVAGGAAVERRSRYRVQASGVGGRRRRCRSHVVVRSGILPADARWRSPALGGAACRRRRRRRCRRLALPWPP
mmetsp:Transcript_147016/g.469816  ORF Transcript_147016/g.469816 Transcript_147016/m.469816 type:complete len:228 (-) Transcript_147016:12-695(-)